MKTLEALQDRDNFNAYYDVVAEKAGQRLDRDAVRYMYDQNTPVMDAVIKLVSR